MAKGIGLIGNFKGKVGNMVGYKLSDSNTGNSQGIRVYQPIVRNPKTSAQAEQRAKLAPINATYRALKMIIDRGNEGLPYGNKSRLAWLKQAFKAEHMPWFVKGASITDPVVCQLTKGSLAGVNFSMTSDSLIIAASTVTSETTINTIGTFSTALIASYPHLKEGDQFTLVRVGQVNNALVADVQSIVLNKTSNEAFTVFDAANGQMQFDWDQDSAYCSIIFSREGANGEHLRTTSQLVTAAETYDEAPFDATSKAAAIESYMSSASANADWAEESIQ